MNFHSNDKQLTDLSKTFLLLEYLASAFLVILSNLFVGHLWDHLHLEMKNFHSYQI